MLTTPPVLETVAPTAIPVMILYPALDMVASPSPCLALSTQPVLGMVDHPRLPQMPVLPVLDRDVTMRQDGHVRIKWIALPQSTRSFSRLVRKEQHCQKSAGNFSSAPK